MPEDLDAVWGSINSRIAGSRILSMLFTENQIWTIDYSKYTELGYTREDVEFGYELMNIYKTLSNYIPT